MKLGSLWNRDYDIHGPAGPTAFWKAADAENPREALLDGVTEIPVEPTLPFGILEHIASSGDEMEVSDDDDDDDMSDEDLEPISSELPGLLQDAELELADITPHAHHV